MSYEPSELKIQAGNGDLYALRLMESTVICSDEVPGCLDFLDPGLSHACTYIVILYIVQYCKA